MHPGPLDEGLICKRYYARALLHVLVAAEFRRAGENSMAVGAMLCAIGPFKADKPPLAFVTARAEWPQINIPGLEPVEAIAAEKVAGKLNDFLKGLQTGLQQVKLIVQGNTARLHFHKQAAGLFDMPGGKKVVDFFE